MGLFGIFDILLGLYVKFEYFVYIFLSNIKWVNVKVDFEKFSFSSCVFRG